MIEAGSNLRIALIGCGALTELYYLPALTEISRCDSLEVSVLVDTNENRLDLLARHFPGAQCFRKVEEIPSGTVDMAVVASPQKFHAQQTVALLEAGIHVLCEKPMASTAEEARKMVDASLAAGKLLAVGLFRRFFPSSQLVHELVAGEALGQPVSFEWVEGGPFNWPAASPSFFQKSASPGGVFADVGAHVIDLLLWWFGEPVKVDYEDDALGGLEANAQVRLRFPSGVSGTVRLSRDTDIPNETRIRFERGSIWFQGASADSVVVQLNGCSYVAKGELHEVPTANAGIAKGFGQVARTYAQSFMEQIRNFCRAIRGVEPLQVPGEQAMRAMELIERCYAARRLMPMPWLTGEELKGTVSISA